MKLRATFLSICLALALAGCNSVAQTPAKVPAENPNDSLKVKVIDTNPDGSHLVVSRLYLKNVGDKPLNVICSVSVSDNKQVVMGEVKDSALPVPLDPGKQEVLLTAIPIADGNSQELSTFSSSCGGEFTDKIDYSVVISDVKDCSFYYQDDKTWYWGPCFKAPDLEPNTKVHCRILALDQYQNAFNSMDYSGNVLMDGTVGFYDFEFPKSSKADVKKIKSYSIKCWE